MLVAILVIIHSSAVMGALWSMVPGGGGGIGAAGGTSMEEKRRRAAAAAESRRLAAAVRWADEVSEGENSGVPHGTPEDDYVPTEPAQTSEDEPEAQEPVPSPRVPDGPFVRARATEDMDWQDTHKKHHPESWETKTWESNWSKGWWEAKAETTGWSSSWWQAGTSSSSSATWSGAATLAGEAGVPHGTPARAAPVEDDNDPGSDCSVGETHHSGQSLASALSSLGSSRRSGHSMRSAAHRQKRRQQSMAKLQKKLGADFAHALFLFADSYRICCRLPRDFARDLASDLLYDLLATITY